MSSPNEPGSPRPGDGPGGTNGSANGAGDGPSRSGQVGFGTPTEHVDVPPWQRGAARTRPPARGEGPARGDVPARGDGPAHAEGGRTGAPPAHSPSGADARLNRFISGGPATPAPGQPQHGTPSPAPAREADSPVPPARNEGPRPETYASELPDLSGAAPRQPQRKPGGERGPADPVTRPPATRATAVGRQSGPVRASMQIRRFDPWSVLKVSLVLSVTLFFVWMIAVAFLYLVLGGMGVWSKLNSNVGDLLTSSGGSGGELVSSGAIFGGAALIGLANIVLLTAMATCGAFIYNLTTDLVGGIEVTLADRD